MSLEERPCPCAAGWTCCPSRNVCVVDTATCPRDAPDAASVDRPETDAAIGAGPPPAVRLASAQSARCLAVNGDHVYWENANGLVVGAPKGGGTVEASHFHTPQADNPKCGIAADGEFVYATSYSLGKILKQNLYSNGRWEIGAHNAFFGQLAGPSSLAIDAENVYVTEHTGGKVTRLSKLGTGEATVLASGRARPHGVALDADYVYFLELGEAGRNVGAVRRVRKAGGPVDVLAADQLSLGDLAFGEGNLFWTRATGEIMRIDFRPAVPGAAVDATPRVMAGGESRPGSLATDGKHVFFGTTFAVREVRIRGAAPWNALGVERAIMPLVAVDATRIFYASNDEVWSVGKRGCPSGATCGGLSGD